MFPIRATFASAIGPVNLIQPSGPCFFFLLDLSKYITEQKAATHPTQWNPASPPCFYLQGLFDREDKLIWVACFLPNQIPNTVDHRYCSPYIPLLALVYTNTHLLGQGRLGENYSSLIYETQGRSKVSRPRQAWPHFLVSGSPSYTKQVFGLIQSFKQSA